MYNAKIKVKYANSKLIYLMVMQTKNTTPHEASEHVKNVLNSWTDIAEFTIIEVSTRLIQLKKFIVVIKLIFRNRPSRLVKVHATAENEEEAEKFVDEIVQNWRDWKEYSVEQIILK
jgi:hypothetical protein